jgi:hypothetical protein
MALRASVASPVVAGSSIAVAGREQLVDATQQRARLSEERGRLSGGAVTGRIDPHLPYSDALPSLTLAIDKRWVSLVKRPRVGHGR